MIISFRHLRWPRHAFGAFLAAASLQVPPRRAEQSRQKPVADDDYSSTPRAPTAYGRRRMSA